MKNKKAMGVFTTITAAVIALVLLYIIVGPIIKGIFVDKQIAYAGGRTEEITIDCDGDSFIGFKDQCPCNPAKTELKSGERCDNPEDEDIERNCPALCKLGLV